MNIRHIQKLSIKFAKRVAIFAALLLKPILIFRGTGILPVKKKSYQEFSPVPYKDQAVFPKEGPRSIRGNAGWTATPTSPMVMGHILKIPNGLVSLFWIRF